MQQGTITGWDKRRIHLDNAVTADKPQILQGGGHTVKVIDASSLHAIANVRADDRENEPIALTLDGGWRHGPFSRLLFDYEAQADEWLDILTAGDPKAADVAQFELLRRAYQYKDKALTVNTYDLSSSRNDSAIFTAGNLIYVADATDATANASIKFGSTSNPAVPILGGTVIRGMPFDNLFISNDAQSGKSLTLVIATDHPDDPLSFA